MAFPGGIDYIRPWVDHVGSRWHGSASPLPGLRVGLGGADVTSGIANMFTGNVGSYYNNALDFNNRWQQQQMDMARPWYNDWLKQFNDTINNYAEQLPQTWSEVNAAHPGYEQEVAQRAAALRSLTSPYVQDLIDSISNRTRGEGGGESSASSGSLSQQTKAALGGPLLGFEQGIAQEADTPAAQMRAAVGAGNTSLVNALGQIRANASAQLYDTAMRLANQLASYSPGMIQGYAQNSLAGPMAAAQGYLGAMIAPDLPIVTQGQYRGNSTAWGPTVGGFDPNGPGGPPRGGGSGGGSGGGGVSGGGGSGGGGVSGDAAALQAQFARPYDWVTPAGGGGYGTPPGNAVPAQQISPWGDPYYAPPTYAAT